MYVVICVFLNTRGKLSTNYFVTVVPFLSLELQVV